MKKLILTVFVLSTLPVFAIKEVTEKEYNSFLKNIGLNETQISQLKELKKEKYTKTNDALIKSRNYRKSHPSLSTKEINNYTSTLLDKIQRDYETDLAKIMNKKQQKQVLFEDSLVY